MWQSFFRNILFLLLTVLFFSSEGFFLSFGRNSRTYTSRIVRFTNTFEIHMIFDFIKQRSQEGISQIQNIATKTFEGKLGEALSDSANYIQKRQKIDAENFLKLTTGLSKSRARLLGGISSAFADKDSAIESRLLKLEEVLLQADIGTTTTETVISDIRLYARQESLLEEDILPVLRARLVEALTPTSDAPRGINFMPKESGVPTVIFVIGANGMGKTTTIGKIASRLRNEANMTVLLGACDTFRAAAVEQLVEWSVRANVSIEVPLVDERGGNPVPVVTRSIQRAKRENFDVCIIDTSGRLSNNFELTLQLQQMKKAIEAELPGAPHETLLVVDGSVGRNAVEQAAAWRKYVGVSGLVVTKLDGTARGGFVVSVVKDLGLPIKFIGVGEKIDDLKDFEPEMFVDALLGNNEERVQHLKQRVEKMFSLTGNINANANAKTSERLESSAERLKAAFTNDNNNNNKVDRLGAAADAVARSNDKDKDNNAIAASNGGVEKSKRVKRPKPQAITNKKNKK